MNRMKVTGILGGTFDPVHLGHLHIAGQAAAVLGLDSVLLMPSARPPHKRSGKITGNRHRMNMLQLAVESCRGLGISTLEYDRSGISYTIDTLRTLRKSDPPVEPLFLIGGDVLAELQTWKMYRNLLDEFDLAVISRPEDPRDRVPPDLEVQRRLVDYPGTGPAQPHFPGNGGRIFRLHIEPVPISSTAVRQAVSLGKPIHGLVPLSVAKYILDHQLYRREVQP